MVSPPMNLTSKKQCLFTICTQTYYEQKNGSNLVKFWHLSEKEVLFFNKIIHSPNSEKSSGPDETLAKVVNKFANTML